MEKNAQRDITVPRSEAESAGHVETSFAEKGGESGGDFWPCRRGDTAALSCAPQHRDLQRREDRLSQQV